MNNAKPIQVDSSWYAKSPEEKTAHANEVAREFGITDADLDRVEEYKAALTEHNAWELPFLGYVNQDGYGYAYAPDEAVAADGWDAHEAFLGLPDNVQTAFAIRMLFTHRDLDRNGAELFLRMNRHLTVNRGEGSVMASAL